MAIEFVDIMSKANATYAQMKLEKHPELRSSGHGMPRITSDSVKAITKALIEEINKELDDLKEKRP